MNEGVYLLAGLFLPLFPLSMVFNALLARIRHPLQRTLLLLLWPQLGLSILSTMNGALPAWLVAWALATSALYAFRQLAMREMIIWTGFLSTSAWALLWLPLSAGAELAQLHYYAAGFSIPLVFLTLLAGMLERRFGAAFTGLYGGLALSMPRFSGVLVICVLAATATPLFPGFFSMLHTLLAAQPLATAVLVVIWLLWSWAGARLLQGLIVGPAEGASIRDLDSLATWGYAAGLAILVALGLVLIGSHL